MKKLEKVLHRLPFEWRLMITVILTVSLCVSFFFFGRSCGMRTASEVRDALSAGEDNGEIGMILKEEARWDIPDYVDYDPLVLNEYSRPGTELKTVNGVVVHYVANPGTTAEQNRSYFNNLAKTHETYASSHFLIGLEGEVMQLMPLDEIAYCSNKRNEDTVSVECCHPDEDGKFNDETYESLITLLADLCRNYSLDPATDIIRHYDVSGKMCPIYYVEHEDAWKTLLGDVSEKLGVNAADTSEK